MLEKHVPQGERIWDINNLWLAFLFLCLCWVAIMVVIIHRDVTNLTQINELQGQRAQVATQILNLRATQAGGSEIDDLLLQLQNLDKRIAAGQQPPTALFMVFSAFEALFIVAYFVLLFRLRAQSRSPALRIYLATLPLGFIYFFLLMTLGRFHTWSQVFGDLVTYLVVLYFALGLIVVGVRSILRGERPKQPAKAGTP